MTTQTEFVTREDLEELLAYKLGPSIRVDTFTTVQLTQPGENYGSNILAIDVVLKPERKKLSLVVKLLPLSPFMREIFQCGVTVRKEIDTYLLVSPEYEKIQRESNIPDEEFLDVFPICYGARATKDKDVGQPADEGSAIVLENLKVKGYECGDRTQGFDLLHTEYIVKHLARFHATAVAIKLKKPDVFEKTVKKACVRVHVTPSPGEDGGLNPMFKAQIDILAKKPGFETYIDKISKVMLAFQNSSVAAIKPPAEPFASISHYDFWTNNMMLAYDEDKKTPTGFKIVDYQVTSYDSPVKDLLFFLHTSTRAGLLEKHYDDLILLYHNTFVGWLSKLGCDASGFSIQEFYKEMDRAAPEELAHIIMLMAPVHLNKEIAHAQKPAEFKENSFAEHDDNSYPPSYFLKMKYLLDDFSRRGWIKC